MSPGGNDTFVCASLHHFNAMPSDSPAHVNYLNTVHYVYCSMVKWGGWEKKKVSMYLMRGSEGWTD